MNAEDPEGCVAVAKLAIALRQTFQCDVFIDLIGYRKYGHNEGDEPTFTQPIEYQIIQKKHSIRTLYREKLIQEGLLNQEQAAAFENEFKNGLQKALEQVPKPDQANLAAKEQNVPSKVDLYKKVETAVPVKTLQELSANFLYSARRFSYPS